MQVNGDRKRVGRNELALPYVGAWALVSQFAPATPGGSVRDPPRVSAPRQRLNRQPAAIGLEMKMPSEAKASTLRVRAVAGQVSCAPIASGVHLVPLWALTAQRPSTHRGAIDMPRSFLMSHHNVRQFARRPRKRGSLSPMNADEFTARPASLALCWRQLRRAFRQRHR